MESPESQLKVTSTINPQTLMNVDHRTSVNGFNILCFKMYKNSVTYKF